MKKISKYILIILCLILLGHNISAKTSDSNNLNVSFVGISQEDNTYIIKIQWEWSSMPDSFQKNNNALIDISWLTSSDGGKPIYSKYNIESSCTIYYYDGQNIIATFNPEICIVQPYGEIQITYPCMNDIGWAKSGEIILKLAGFDESKIKEINYIFKYSHENELFSAKNTFINFPLGLGLNLSILKESITDIIASCTYDSLGQITKY